MKGIILAGGRGTRLYPMTTVVSKQLLPVYDKPMIYYPLSMLMLADIKDILIISDPLQLPNYQRLFGSGEQWGLNFSFIEQPEPRGLAESFILGKEFIGNESVSLILGDNIFFGHDLPKKLQSLSLLSKGATIFAYEVRDPNRYGVIEFDELGKAISLEEKPKHPKSNFAVPGFYFYDSNVADYAMSLKPSIRGELEITDLNKCYLEEGILKVEPLGRGVAWLDAGTPRSLIDASHFVQSIENRQGMMISCIEEIAFRKGFISLSQLENIIGTLGDNYYRDYLLKLVEDFSNND